MLIQTEDPKVYRGGPLDVICILHDTQNNTYHPSFLEEKPLPGPVPSVKDTTIVRLKSRMHNTEGFRSFEEAVQNVKEEFAKQILLSEENLWIQKPMEWDGEAFTMMVPNWKISEVHQSQNAH